MHDDSKILELVQIAIDEGRIEDARTLLRPLMERNVIEAFYHASRVAYTQEQALEFLRYALLLEPENELVRKQVETLEQVYTGQNNAIVPVPAELPASKTAASRIKKTSSLFNLHGWQIISQDAELAHLVRRQSMSAVSAFVIGLFFNIPGLLILLAILLTGEKLHIFIEADEDDILLSSNKGNQIISHPQQAIIMIEKFRGVRFWQGMAFGFLGFLFSSIILFFLFVQTQQGLNLLAETFESIQTTLTAEAPRGRF
jgi:hypothetical protein